MPPPLRIYSVVHTQYYTAYSCTCDSWIITTNAGVEIHECKLSELPQLYREWIVAHATESNNRTAVYPDVAIVVTSEIF